MKQELIQVLNELNSRGLEKETSYLTTLLEKNAIKVTMMGAHPDAFDTGELMALMQLKMDEMGMPPGSVPNNKVHDWSKRCAHKDNPCNDEIVSEFLRKQEAGEAMHFEPGSESAEESLPLGEQEDEESSREESLSELGRLVESFTLAVENFTEKHGSGMPDSMMEKYYHFFRAIAASGVSIDHFAYDVKLHNQIKR